ncbi:RDD family protein [Aeromonas enteropelogenes]|uniref:RDD family protein n=1 Tax=Aeromonas enteropelogenes TaxID=29489 RepID=UPI00191C9980|nr:RDD family protein [Aeromonas enteropelogenes]MBL0458165.1 RDD family protein [Aeromonas enteropelogenes]
MAKRKQVQQTPPSSTKPGYPSAGLLRRLGALLYDALVVTSLLIIAGFIGMAVAKLLLVTGMASVPAGEDSLWLLTRHRYSLIYTLWLTFVICGFYTWFWTRAGQTIGMRAWRLRIQNEDGSNIRITQALIRLATAAFGLGNLMCLFNRKEPRAFQDIWAECRVVVLDKQANLELLNK